jgi:hypothetical protein
MTGRTHTIQAPGPFRRRLLAAGTMVAASGAAGVGVAACGPGGGGAAAPPPAAERVTIEHYNYFDPEQLERMRPVRQRFQDAHPAIRVEHLPAVGSEADLQRVGTQVPVVDPRVVLPHQRAPVVHAVGRGAEPVGRVGADRGHPVHRRRP